MVYIVSHIHLSLTLFIILRTIYNIHRHLQERHPCWDSNTAATKELKEFREKILVSNVEEGRLKIPEEKQGWSAFTYAAVCDLRHLNHLPSIRDERGDSPRRQRPQTPSIASVSLPIAPSYYSSTEPLPTFNNNLDVFC